MPIFHKFLFQIKEDKPFTKQLRIETLERNENIRKINLNKTKTND